MGIKLDRQLRAEDKQRKQDEIQKKLNKRFPVSDALLISVALTPWVVCWLLDII